MALYKWNVKLAWIWVSNWIVTSATAPVSPVEWMVWYDTTNDVLKSYDGTNWNVAGKEYEQGNWINISNDTISVDTSVVATKTYVDEHDTVVSSTAPSSPTEWMVWYDTTNDQLKVYDWTNWNVTGKEYYAGEWISIWSVQSYAAMRWPAPSWYHVPSKDEWADLCRILGMTFDKESDATTMGIYLKMPMAGYRDYNNATIHNVMSWGVYWSSTPYDTNFAYSLLFSSESRTPYDYSYRTVGYSIRCFKDTPIIPTSSWTTLYNGSSIASGAGIFRNSTDGLISISGDGQNWYTIMDKNLWATAVYNYWDTITDANCGYFYQWGNNYWFAHSWTVTTSSTKVDASNYWPWNYYSSSTFITWNDRSSVQNDNLWGATTWVVTIDNTIINTGVLSVNWQIGDVTIESWWITNDTTGTTTTVTKIWAGTEAEYALITPDATTIYYVF